MPAGNLGEIKPAYRELHVQSSSMSPRQRRFSNNIGEAADFAGGLSPKVQIVIEQTISYLWIIDQLEPYEDSLHLAVPFKVRVIAESKSKTNRYDSRILAELLRTNFLPESCLAPKEIRVLRDLIRQRNLFIKNRTRFKNRIRQYEWAATFLEYYRGFSQKE